MLILWILYLLALVFFPLSASVTIYHLFISNPVYGPLLLFTLALFVGALVVETRLGVIILFCALFLAGASYCGHFYQTGFFTYEEEVDVMRFDYHVYHLLLWIPDVVEAPFYYSLYECDSFDVFCRQVDSVSHFELNRVGIEEVETVSLVGDDSVKIEINGRLLER